MHMNHNNSTKSLFCSGWVNASAGTGKTTLLIKRILGLLLAQQKKIMCLTFTNAAVEEIIRRITTTLRKWHALQDQELYKEIYTITQNKPDRDTLNIGRRLIIDIDNTLNVYTLHSFCYKIINIYGPELNISPNDKIVTSSEICKRALHNFYRHADHSSVSELTFILTEDKLLEIFTEFIEKSLYHAANIENEILTTLTVDLDKIDHASHDLLHGDHPIYRAMQSSSKFDIANSTTLLTQKDFQQYSRVFVTQDNVPKKLSSIISKQCLQSVPQAQEFFLQEQTRVLNILEYESARQIASQTADILHICRAVYEYYRMEKKDHLTYDEVIKLALFILDKPWIRSRVEQTIDHLLIDEAQDTNRYQWLVIDKLTEEFFAGQHEVSRTLFVVGDIKQSIYSFQGVVPELFQVMKKHFKARAQDLWYENKITTSFRSSKAILNLVDTLFADTELRQYIQYCDDQVKHECFHKKAFGKVEIWPLATKKTDEQEALLAITITRVIVQWLNEKRTIDDTVIRASDIMILLRKRSSFINHFFIELQKYDIPVNTRELLNLTKEKAIQDLLALGKFVLHVYDDQALLQVLRSPLFCITERELLDITRKKTEFLLDSIEQHNNEIYRKLTELITLSREKTPFAFYSSIFHSYKESFQKVLGNSSIELIKIFLQKVSQHNYIHLEYLLPQLADLTYKNSNDNGVHVTTVHGAKGLQAKIVFLLNTTDIPLTAHNFIENSDGIPLWPYSIKNKYCSSLREKERRKTYSEYIRLLYVALTRAQNELYIIGQMPNHVRSWYSWLTSQRMQNSIYTHATRDLTPMLSKEETIFVVS